MTDAPAQRPALSLSVRLIAGAMVWLALMLAIGGGVLAVAFRDTVEREYGHRLDAMLRGLIAAMETTPDGTVKLARPLGNPRFGQVYSGWYWQITPPAGRAVRSRSLWDGVIETVAGGPALHLRRAKGPNGEDLLIAERDLRLPGTDGVTHVLIAGGLNEIREGVRRFDLMLISALGLLGAGLAVAILIQVRFGLRPLRAMTADLDAVRTGERARLAERYPQEVAPLAKAMNNVLDKDAELIERARTHVGNLTHALKTPLAVLSAEVESGQDKTVMLDQVRTMRRLIEHHLGRASAVAGAERVLGLGVPVRETAGRIAAVLGRVFAERALSIDIDVPADTVFRGHREDLEEILGNLMENACKWAAGRVRVSARQSASGFELTVSDDGPGMAPQQAAEAARRGKRLDTRSPGWGLGLSIVSDLVEVNGGDIAFSRADIGGLAVHVRLPNRT